MSGKTMELAPESAVQFQAQIAEFSLGIGAEFVASETQLHILHRAVGRYATGDAIAEGARHSFAEDAPGMFLPSNFLQRYSVFTQNTGTETHDYVARRTQLSDAYETKGFADYATILHLELESFHNAADHPAFLGNGRHSNAFQIEHEDQDYVLRLPKIVEAPLLYTERYVKALVRAAGVPRLEQPVAASYTDGVVVTERMPGEPLNKVPTQTLRNVSDEQLGEFVDTILAANEVGLRLDDVPSNVLYDSQQGFGAIDLLQYNRSKIPAGELMDGVMNIIKRSGTDGNPAIYTLTAEDCRRAYELAEVRLDLMYKLGAICARQFGGEEAAHIEHSLEFETKQLDNAIAENKRKEQGMTQPPKLWTQSLKAAKMGRV